MKKRDVGLDKVRLGAEQVSQMYYRLLIAWLIEASLLSSGQETRVLPTLLASPSLFPFDISLSGKEFSDSSSRIALYRQGRNEELVSLQPLKQILSGVDQNRAHKRRV